MNWHEKLEAMSSIAGNDLLRTIDFGRQWICHCGELGGDGLLQCAIGSGRTPEDAVNSAWISVTQLVPGKTHVYARGKRFVWIGYRWRDFDVNGEDHD
jgi:hypothetical protein